MKTTFGAVGICALLIQPVFCVAQDQPENIPLKDLMTAEQYKEAGIDKLTPEERAALSRWLRDYAKGASTVPIPNSQPTVEATAKAVAESATNSKAADAAVSKPPVPDENFGLTKPLVDPEKTAVLYAKVVEPFRGWSGKTVFRLDNGQVWRQRVSGRFTYTGDDNRVSIGKSSWGLFEMRLIAGNRSIGVKRIK